MTSAPEPERLGLYAWQYEEDVSRSWTLTLQGSPAAKVTSTVLELADGSEEKKITGKHFVLTRDGSLEIVEKMGPDPECRPFYTFLKKHQAKIEAIIQDIPPPNPPASDPTKWAEAILVALDEEGLVKQVS